jgi:hypothetical protein
MRTEPGTGSSSEFTTGNGESLARLRAGRALRPRGQGEHVEDRALGHAVEIGDYGRGDGVGLRRAE